MSTETEIFLIACLNSLKEKPDWSTVANSCGIVTPAAAQKRFSRILEKGRKASGTVPQTPTKVSKNTSPKKAKTTPRKTPDSPSKGRKRSVKKEGEDENGDLKNMKKEKKEYQSSDDKEEESSELSDA